VVAVAPEVRPRWAGEGVGPRCAFCFFNPFQKSLPELYMPLGTGVLRGFVGALGTELFAGRTVPRALCQELPLGRACAEWKPSCAESMLLSTQAANPVVSTSLCYLKLNETMYETFKCLSP
jgi:hypothetical protein